jgi:hypothetical protein
MDVDVLLIGEGAQLRSLLENLRRAKFARRREQVVALGETDLLQFTYRPAGLYVDVQVDLLLAKSAFTREALRRSVTLTSDVLGFEVQVLSCEDLILLKLLAGRIIDRADAAALLRANRTVVDEKLLNAVAAQLNLTSALAAVQREAFG